MIKTQRLVLRPWRDSDRPLMAAIHADTRVMRFLRKPLDRAGSDAYVARNEQHYEAHGFCVWAVEAPGLAPLIGAVGLTHVPFDASFTPAVEVGWRLAADFWRRGFAAEAARAALADGFGRLSLAEIVAMTVPANLASWGLMERLGMVREAEFDHPNLPKEHPLCRHLLYRMRRPDASIIHEADGKSAQF